MSGFYRKPIGKLLITEDDARAFNFMRIERSDDERVDLILREDEIHDLHHALGRTIERLRIERERRR